MLDEIRGVGTVDLGGERRGGVVVSLHQWWSETVRLEERANGNITQTQ